MTYSAIDGDIADFIDSMAEVTNEFSTNELRTYLLNQGHTLEQTVGAILTWQEDRFEALDPSLNRFKLSDAGRTAVEELRDSLA